MLEGEHGRGGGVVEVDERRDAAAVADDRELPLAHRLEQPVVGGAVEAAVAKRDAAGVGDGLVEIAHRRVGLAHRRQRVGSSGSSSVLTGPPSRAYRKLAKLWATNRRTPASRAAASRASVPFGAQPVGLGEAAVEVPGEAQVRQRGRLVDDRVGLALEHGLAHGARVEQIELIGFAPSARTRSVRPATEVPITS